MLAEAVVDDRIAPSALVTGGASGFGKAICDALAREGYLVAVADRDEVGARSVADACGGVALTVDIADEESVVALLVRAHEALDGKLDAIAIAAASIDPAANSAVIDFVREHARSVIGTHLCIREAAKVMERGGRICIVAPAAAETSALQAATCGAMMALTRQAARSYATAGIAVNGVTPGPSASTQRVADAVAWLLSPRAQSITGEVLSLNGSFS